MTRAADDGIELPLARPGPRSRALMATARDPASHQGLRAAPRIRAHLAADRRGSGRDGQPLAATTVSHIHRTRTLCKALADTVQVEQLLAVNPPHDRNAVASLAPNPPGSGPPGSSTPSLPPLGHIGCSPSTAWLPTPAHAAASCCICGGKPWISTRLRLFSAGQPRWYSAKRLRELPRAAGPVWSASTAKLSPYCGSTIASRPENGFRRIGLDRQRRRGLHKPVG